MSASNSCPCNSRKRYINCCAPYLTGKATAPTAVLLMRSRYTAFTTGNIDYLIATRHADFHQQHDRRVLRQTCRSTHWFGLTILKTKQGQPDDRQGIVEFVAEYRDTQVQGFQAAAIQQLHERSNFIKQAGQWFYTDGRLLPPVKLQPKISPPMRPN